jgi:CRP-like cAMP-binding protein
MSDRIIGDLLAKHLELFGRLSSADADALRGVRGEVIALQRGEDVLKDRGPPSHTVVVIEGLLQRYRINLDGQRQVHSIYIPSDAPCLEALPMDYMDSSLGALVPSKVGLVPRAEMFRIMDAHPNVLTLIWRETLVQAAINREWLMRNSQTPAHTRIAHFLCEVMVRCRAAGLNHGDTCDLPLMDEDFRDALALSALDVARTLKVLHATGAVRFEGGKVTVRDWGQLTDIAEFDDSYLHLPRRRSV